MERPLHSDTLKEAREAIQTALILYPKTPAIQIAETMYQDRDEFAEALSAILLKDFYRHGIVAERRKQASEQRAQFLLPGFEHLPVIITGYKGKRVKLLDANISSVRTYCWMLGKAAAARVKNDAKLEEARALLRKMKARKDPGVTVREVILIDA
jgi:hypothetical protein